MKFISAWYINLKRSPDKSMYTRAMLMGVDCLYENIHRIDAHDFKDYENIETLSDAAVADGFDYFNQLQDCWRSPGDIATMWSWSKSFPSSQRT